MCHQTYRFVFSILTEAQDKIISYLIDAFADFIPFSRRDKIPDLPCFPAIADGTISLCGGYMRVVLTISFAIGPLSMPTRSSSRATAKEPPAMNCCWLAQT